MKDRVLIKRLLWISSITIFFGFTALNCKKSSSSVSKEEVTVGVVRHILEEKHYVAQDLNDELSEKIYTEYLERLDYSKRLLTKSQVKKLDKYKFKIDDELKLNQCGVFELASEMIDERIEETEGYFADILAKPFDFTIDEELELDPDKLDYASNDKELKERWRKYLKYQVINRVHNKLTAQEKAMETNDTLVAKTLSEIEIEVRAKVLKDHKDWYSRLKKLTYEDRFHDFINAYTSCYDPHTNFFPPKDKENFDISISGRLEGIGATLQESDGYVKVTRIVPGSASYRQGELESGDLILAVAQGDKEAVDIVDMRLDDAVQLIRGPKGSEVRLTVKKADGTETIIPIIRDIVVLSETYAKSAIVKDSLGDNKIGYIKLPKFYADFSNSGGPNCSEDVLKEIQKLKKENINGMIFDLRDNGGGSLQDVVTMSGFFIDQGPIVQIKARTGDPYVYSDYDKRIFYDGPLIVLVNNFSASASEIFAAAMQDYGRGIVMGSKSSYGKGTVQRFENLDNYVNKAFNSMKSFGAMKITGSKFYRVDGGATQWKGVEPDIVVPDNYMYIEVGEKELNSSLPWDEITPAEYTKWEPTYRTEAIVLSSSKRIGADTTFAKVEQNARRYKKVQDHTTVSLKLEDYRVERKAEKVEADKYSNLFHRIEPLQVGTVQDDLIAIEQDSTKSAGFEILNKNLRKDHYLWEAMQVMDDMIKE